MTDKTTEKTPSIKQYDGPRDSSSLTRGIDTAQRRWNGDENLKIGSLDDLLTTEIRAALNRKSDSISLLDIGSGPQGQLLKELATQNNILPETSALLRQNPDFHIYATGLTDAESKETFLHAKPLNIPESDNRQIHAQNVEYSLTAAQTLENFTQVKKIENLDLVLATFSLTYLGPKVFEQTIRTVIQKLSPGGKFIAAGFAEDHPALQRNEMGMTQLKTRNAHEDLYALDLHKFHQKLFNRVSNEDYSVRINQQEFQEINQDIEKVEDYLEQVGLLDPAFLTRTKRNLSLYFEMLSSIYYDIKFKRKVTPDRLKAHFLDQRRLKNISRPIWSLEKKLLIGMRQKKKMILEQLGKEFGDQIEIKFSDHIFEITKKVS
jgi:hypothetical protein